MELSIQSVEKGLQHLGHEGKKALADVAKHPQLLAGLIAGGPAGLLALEELHRGGHLGHMLNKIGLGGLTSRAPGSGGGTTPGGGHADPGSMLIDTKEAEGYCWPGGRKPFPLVGNFTLAAGAQTQGTDLGDFHAATSNPTIITTNDLIPGNVRVRSCRLTVGVKMLTTAGAETLGFLESLWVVERVNGTEIARWTLADLGCTVDHSGLLTSGATSNQIEIMGKWQKWERNYDPTTPHALALQCTRTQTTIQAIDFNFAEAGNRP